MGLRDARILALFALELYLTIVVVSTQAEHGRSTADSIQRRREREGAVTRRFSVWQVVFWQPVWCRFILNQMSGLHFSKWRPTSGALGRGFEANHQ